MAMTPDEIDALPNYTAAQHLKIWKRADIEVAGSGTSYAVAGRQLTRANAKEITDKISYWQEMVAAEEAGESGLGNVLVRFQQD